MDELKFNADGTVKLDETTFQRLDGLKQQASLAIGELLDAAQLKKGQILVVGCSTSEVTGNVIGKASVREVADALVEGMLPILKEKGIYLAAQCCEHLNRALIVETECAELYGLDEVCVRPVAKAGGSFATAVYEKMESPVAVESIKAHAGIDIGGTFIGMHLKAVAVPVRLSVDKIGEANILCAKTRPKYVGGPRAKYE